jgi:CheY-like chemotaxis protein
MEQQTFTSLFKDLISRLYDRVAIETHPLAPYFPSSEESNLRRAEVIQRLILDEIEHLRPAGREVLQSAEWRPYLILHRRYVDGQDPHEIAASLYIGDRQLRRDHSRALQALSTLIWEGFFQPAARKQGDQPQIQEQEEFEIHAEVLDLHEVIHGVMGLVKRRLEIENVQLRLELAANPLQVFADRILLRQILLSLLNYVLHLRAQPLLILRTTDGAAEELSLVFEVDEQWANTQGDEQDSLEFVRLLSQRLPASVKESYPPHGLAGRAEIHLVFAKVQPKSLLVVDDQTATLKMFQRYLSRTNLEVVGLSDPAQAVETVRQLQPVLIVLDVMMPRIDGWEILQALQLDPQTKQIPIIICSAWGEPELARSLGATEFLKKPVIQKDFLAALARLSIIQE